jgi:hypothetical protein
VCLLFLPLPLLLLPTAVASQRADTQGSFCNPDCNNLNLPRDIILIKMVPREIEKGDDPNNAACDMETVTKTKNAHAKGHIILLQVLGLLRTSGLGVPRVHCYHHCVVLCAQLHSSPWWLSVLTQPTADRSLLVLSAQGLALPQTLLPERKP